jgi:crossover junction endodeoxyribonuclease RuvC
LNAPVSTLRILGVDPGTRLLGYGVIDLVPTARVGAVEVRYVECGVLQAPTTPDMATRIGVLSAALAEVMVELQPHVVALEQAFTGRNAASALKLGLCRGAVMLLSAQQHLPLFEYAPTKIKRVVVGRGRASKQDVQSRVRLLCRLRREPSADAADALAIALCHAHIGVPTAAFVVEPPRRRVTPA